MVVVGRRRSINTTPCPDDFSAAFKRYILTWEEMLDQLLSEPRVFDDAIFRSPADIIDIDTMDVIFQNSTADSVFQARLQAMIHRQDNGADLPLDTLKLAYCSKQISDTGNEVRDSAIRQFDLYGGVVRLAAVFGVSWDLLGVGCVEFEHGGFPFKKDCPR